MLSGRLQLSNAEITENSTFKKHAIGSLAESRDGRLFRYAFAGATDLVAGNLLVAANPVADHQNRLIDDVVTAPAIGDKEVTLLSVGSTAGTLDQYADGYLNVRDGTGEGYLYQIEGHTAFDSAGTNVVIKLRDPIEVALDSTTEVSLEFNPWDNVVISATDQADLPVGIAHTAIGGGSGIQFGWVQTHGLASAFCDETFASGGALTTGAGTAGQLSIIDADDEVQVAIAHRAGIADEYIQVFLTLD